MTNTSRRILVWDAPVRVFHWLLAASFIGAFVTAESERWRLVHVTLGYTVGGLVLFRLLWGVMGTKHARFATFVRGPRAVAAYLRSLLSGQPQHSVGHNPAGALAIVGLLGGALLLVGTGWATYNDVGPGALEELHEGLGNALLALVVVHVLGVIVSSRLHGENLVRAMVTGHKQGTPEEGIRHAWRSLAVVMLAAVLGFWGWQYQQAPDAATLADQAATQQAQRHADRRHHAERDDD